MRSNKFLFIPYCLALRCEGAHTNRRRWMQRSSNLNLNATKDAILQASDRKMNPRKFNQTRRANRAPIGSF